MRVIGAGLPRTGTTSLRISLEALGFDPCFHMVNIWRDPSLISGWSSALSGTMQPARLLDSQYQAAVDWPVAFYWQELIKEFPESKVVLTVREGDAWTRSIERTIWEHLFGDGLMKHLSCARAAVDPRWKEYREMMKQMWKRSGLMKNPEQGLDPVSAAEAMERHNQEVKDGVPSDRLLVWRPSEGIGPLADFLGVAHIDWEVPYTNGEAAFVEQVTQAALSTIGRSLEDGRSANTVRPERRDKGV